MTDQQQDSKPAPSSQSLLTLPSSVVSVKTRGREETTLSLGTIKGSEERAPEPGVGGESEGKEVRPTAERRGRAHERVWEVSVDTF